MTEVLVIKLSPKRKDTAWHEARAYEACVLRLEMFYRHILRQRHRHEWKDTSFARLPFLGELHDTVSLYRPEFHDSYAGAALRHVSSGHWLRCYPSSSLQFGSMRK